MRRVNVDRMRRHMARTTPDLRRWRFTDAEMVAAAEYPDSLIAGRLDHWGRLMQRKHGDRGRNPEVTVYRDGDPLLGTTVVEAKVRTP